jgi:hypothetical protein
MANQQASGDPEQAAFLGIVAEYLFVLLPLIVLVLTRFFRGHVSEVFSAAEWSFAAAILFGQTIVKFVSGITKLDYKIGWQGVAVVVSLLIVLGLVPSLVALSVVLVSAQSSAGLTIFQLVFFVLATAVFLSVGRFGQVLLRE